MNGIYLKACPISDSPQIQGEDTVSGDSKHSGIHFFASKIHNRVIFIEQIPDTDTHQPHTHTHVEERAGSNYSTLHLFNLATSEQLRLPIRKVAVIIITIIFSELSPLSISLLKDTRCRLPTQRQSPQTA